MFPNPTFEVSVGRSFLQRRRRGSDLYLIMQDADPKQGKVSPEQHKYCAMLPQSDPTSTGYLRKLQPLQHCLKAFPGRKYGELEHLEEMDNPRYASMCFQNIHPFGETSVSRFLGVFLCCLFLFLVGFVLFVTGRHLAFCSPIPNMWEWLIKDNTF